VAAWHAKGVKVVFHSDGNVWPLLPDLIATGVDGLNPLEVAAGMHPGEIRQRYPHLLLFGGISYAGVLLHGSPAQVAEVTRDTIRRASPGYFVGSDTELGDDIPLANALAMYEAALACTL
jgi:uroporphyrinogen decarboxylase